VAIRNQKESQGDGQAVAMQTSSIKRNRKTNSLGEKTAKYEQERQHRIEISMRRERKKPVIPRAYSATDGKWTKRNQMPDKP
jgi:hypothetical protein